MLFPDLNDIPAIIASRPTEPEQYAPLLVDPAPARVVRADEVKAGDTILAGIDERTGGFDIAWFNEEYTAHPMPYAPTCGCGSCATMADATGPVVNLGDDNPWDVCDPWLAADLVLIVPAA